MSTQPVPYISQSHDLCYLAPIQGQFETMTIYLFCLSSFLSSTLQQMYMVDWLYYACSMLLHLPFITWFGWRHVSYIHCLTNWRLYITKHVVHIDDHFPLELPCPLTTGVGQRIVATPWVVSWSWSIERAQSTDGRIYRHDLSGNYSFACNTYIG